jgi:hypothetical protein
MNETAAELLSLAGLIPALAVGALFTFYSGRLVGRLETTHRATWLELGSPSRFWLASPADWATLLPWLRHARYLTLGNDETSALGKTCRRIYFAMVAVAIWLACLVLLWKIAFR